MSYLYPELPVEGFEELKAKRVDAYEAALRGLLELVDDPVPALSLHGAPLILDAAFTPRPHSARNNIPADTMLGHVNNAIAALSLAGLEHRIADGGELNEWAGLRSSDLERIIARLEGVAAFLSSLASLERARTELDEDDDSLPF